MRRIVGLALIAAGAGALGGAYGLDWFDPAKRHWSGVSASMACAIPIVFGLALLIRRPAKAAVGVALALVGVWGVACISCLTWLEAPPAAESSLRLAAAAWLRSALPFLYMAATGFVLLFGAARIVALLQPFLGLGVVYCFFLYVTPDAFFTAYNAKTYLTQSVIVGVGALGMTLVIIAGGIDLSVGSLIALGTVATAQLLRALGGEASSIDSALLPLLAAIGGVAICAFCGFLSGLMTALFGIVPFIITLGMMQIARGAAKWIGREQTVIAPVNWLEKLMYVDPEPRWLLVAPGVWTMLALLVLVAVLLRYTVFGRYVFAIGSNEATARLCGVNVRRMRIAIYTLCGAFAGVAAVMQFANLTLGDPTAAIGMELDIIAAVVIGGGSLSGGEGSALGSLIGALLMAILRNGCNMIGIPNFIQDIVIGAIIISAVGIDRLKHRGAD